MKQELLNEFQKYMLAELNANDRKGGRGGWLSCTPMQLVLEVYYHTGKLQEAVKNNDSELIKEHSADVANLAMMVLDASGYLLPKDNIELVNATSTATLHKISSPLKYL